MDGGTLNVASMLLVLAFLLGCVSGLRTFTGLAILWIMRHRGPLAYVLAAAAVFEYYFDLHPNAPPRTRGSSIVVRLISGAFVGWWAAIAGGTAPASCAVAGAIGAVIGAYGSLAIRRWAIAAIGNVASGLLEDIIAVAAAVAIVARL